MNTTKTIAFLVGLLLVDLAVLSNNTKAAPQKEQPPVQSGIKPVRVWTVLQSTTYQAVDGLHQLTLSEKELPSVRELAPDTVDRYMHVHSDDPALPNTVFTLTDSVARSQERLVWVQYVPYNKAILPHQHWFANLVWPEGEPQPYVVLTMSIGTTVEASVYKVPLKADLGPLAQEPDLNRFEKLPKASTALSRVYITFVVHRFVDGVTGAVKLDAVADRDGILLRSHEREIATEPPFYIRFNPRSGQWQKGTNPDALQGLDSHDILE